MALRIEITKLALEEALEKQLASIKRAMNNAKQPEFKVIYEKQQQELHQAIRTIAEIK